jgi:SAM-dependent methyltransferase
VALSPAQATEALGVAPPSGAQVVWHDLECGSYAADLPLWRELAESHPGGVLEVGAGTGRVTLELASRGYALSALERDLDLCAALRSRAVGLNVDCVHADARRFDVGGRRHALCIVPMQTVQLFGGRDGRARFLRCARAALRPGGLLACAVLGRPEPFDCAVGDQGPAPESTVVGGMLYQSAPIRVAVRRRGVVIARERRILEMVGAPSGGARPGRLVHREPSVVELDRVTPRMLRREGSAAGFCPGADCEVPPTEDHAGSSVVMLRA